MCYVTVCVSGFGMDNIHVDPRKQELLEARFLGGRVSSFGVFCFQQKWVPPAIHFHSFSFMPVIVSDKSSADYALSHVGESKDDLSP